MAEAILRLRRLRGLSQEELASAVGSKQPAIARLESGRTNPSLGTLRKVAEALDSTLRIEMEPVEWVDPANLRRPWWETVVVASEHGAKALNTYNLTQHFHIYAFGLSTGSPAGMNLEEPDYYIIEAKEPQALPAPEPTEVG